MVQAADHQLRPIIHVLGYAVTRRRLQPSVTATDNPVLHRAVNAVFTRAGAKLGMSLGKVWRIAHGHAG
jgi:hypothetical protein